MSGPEERSSAEEGDGDGDGNLPDVPDAPRPPKPQAPKRGREWGKAMPYVLLLDFARRPESKVAWIVRGVAIAVALAALWRRVDGATALLRKAKAPAPIPTQEIDDYSFRLPEHTRREIFADLAAAEVVERARAIQANSWNGQLWSREDDRGYYERVAARAAAAKYRVSLSQVYLVLDEGIRARWPASNGEPLPPTTPPLRTRSSW